MMLNAKAREPCPADRLADLVYELVDAHGDTAELARELAGDPDWAAHLDYLRDLQRVAREALAGEAQVLDSARAGSAPTAIP